MRGGYSIDVWVFALSAEEYIAAKAALGQLRRDNQINIQIFRGVLLEQPFSGLLEGLLLSWWMWRLKTDPFLCMAEQKMLQ